MSEFNCYQLAEIDDFLTETLVDNLYYWAEVRKIQKNLVRFKTPSKETIISLIQEHLLKDKNLNRLIEEFMELPEIIHFLNNCKYSNDNDKNYTNQFIKHAKRYFSVYSIDSGFEVNTTDRYNTRLESNIVATKSFNPGEEIKYLVGYLSELSETDEINLKSISVIDTTRGGDRTSIMLGPLRFVNHDCNANAIFQSSQNSLRIRALRKILVGEEITTIYSKDYFGLNNRNCKCTSCERNKSGFYDVSKKPVIPTPQQSDSNDKSDDEVNIISIEYKKPIDVLDSDQSEEEYNKKRLKRTGTKNKINENDSILSIIPIDKSIDSFSETTSLAPLYDDQLRQRRNHRTLNKLHMVHVYQKEYIIRNQVYDCRQCGVYFKGVKGSLQNLYCPRCIRHSKIFGLAYPYTKASSSLFENKELNHFAIDRSSIAILAQKNLQLKKLLSKNLKSNIKKTLRRNISKSAINITNNHKVELSKIINTQIRSSLRIKSKVRKSFKIKDLSNDEGGLPERLSDLVLLSNDRVIEEDEIIVLD